ncbi:hypothetical protein C0991_006168 [Blastosporella zonata]|nr:hypothetical protein C0991_006168 [Blastosporella zonata]
MANTSNNLPPTFPNNQQFDGDNYVAFRDRALLLARARGALGYLNGTIMKPSALSPGNAILHITTPNATPWTSYTPSLEEWEVHNAWALSLLIYNTKNPIGLRVNMTGTAAAAWKALTDQYDCASKIAAVAAENHLRATKLAEGGNFQKHTKTLQIQWNKAVEKGADIKDKTFRAIIIASLPPSWNTIISSLHGTKTSSKLLAGLAIHWDLTKEQNIAAGISVTALQAKVTPSKPKLACVNTNCRRTGHTIQNCYWPGRGKEGQFPVHFRNRGQHTPGATTTPTAKLAAANIIAQDPASYTTYALTADDKAHSLD